MRPAALLVLVLLTLPGAAWPCGEKYLVRCVANQPERLPSPEDAKAVIVIIADGAAAIKHLVRLDFPRLLVERGYRVYLVKSAKELAEVTADVNLDLAIVYWQRADTYEAMLSPDTTILPVVEQNDAREVPLLSEKYAFILKVPGQEQTTLLTVDYTVEDTSLR